MRFSFPRSATLICAATLSLTLAACESANIPWSGFNEVYSHGYIPDARLDQVKPGMGVQQVLDNLGTPSTVSTVGNKTFYYIQQRKTRIAQFMPAREVERRVWVVYFNQGFKVERIANYGIEDGRVFDFISRTTPTGGGEQSFLRNLLVGLAKWG
ncbi:MAG: outer membrane protein assembly factor BamE [Beijerinckiaceae bacterium]